MALTTNTTQITLDGVSTVEHEGKQVAAVTMSATISEHGHSSVSTTTLNQVAYDANKNTCRDDIDSFYAKVREIEDAGVEAVTQ
ncbi:MAG: hypothetical protein J6I97_00485 [Agathobacter sp.]|nr:hypothetical protein [Agathobacter sp.]